MIRINLLEKRQDAPARSASSSEPKLGGSSGAGGLLALLVILIGLGAIGARWYQLSSRIGALDTEIAAADQEIAQLRQALAKMNEFQEKKKQLEHRVTIISDLKRRQEVPVLLLDMVSRQLPEYLWLDAMTESGGAISLSGRATTYNAVSNFYNNLTESPFFSDVMLGTTQKVPEGVSFQLSCRFVPPKPGQVIPPVIPAAPGAPQSPAIPPAPLAAAGAPRG